MIEVNNSTATVSQWTTGVFLKVDSTDLPDKFVVEYEHSDSTTNCEALTLQRLGKTFGKFAIVPVPNYLLTVAGTVTVYYCSETITVTVTAAIEPSEYANDCRCDNDVDRAAIETVLDVVYPIGSIYMSVNSTSPAILFGGTWERLEDAFLLGAGTNHSAGETGGAETAEIPAHKHLAPIGTRNNNTAAAISFQQGRETAPFSGSKSVFSAANNTDSYSDVSVPYTAANEAETVGTMPPYLAVYMWKRVADTKQYDSFVDANGNTFYDANGNEFMVEVN